MLPKASRGCQSGDWRPGPDDCGRWIANRELACPVVVLGAARDWAARGLLVRTAISCIEASGNDAACTARNDCATKGVRADANREIGGPGAGWLQRAQAGGMTVPPKAIRAGTLARRATAHDSSI